MRLGSPELAVLVLALPFISFLLIGVIRPLRRSGRPAGLCRGPVLAAAAEPVLAAQADQPVLRDVDRRLARLVGAAAGLSDDEIASLLTDTDMPALGASDTTIGPESHTPLRTLSPKTPLPQKKHFKTVAEEAQEIIRLHLESLNAGGAKS